MCPHGIEHGEFLQDPESQRFWRNHRRSKGLGSQHEIPVICNANHSSDTVYCRDVGSAIDGWSTACQPPLPADIGWPRQYTDGAAALVLCQPQVDSWKDFAKATARFAVA